MRSASATVEPPWNWRVCETKKDGRAEMRIRPLCYAGVLGSVSEDHASRAIRQARCSPEEAGLCEYDTLRSLRIAVLPRRGTLHLYNR